jgi:hypothetical protein
VNVLFAVASLALAALSLAWRFGLVGTGERRDALQRYAAERGYVMTEDGAGFEVVRDGLRLRARMVVLPGHPVRSTVWVVEGDARSPLREVLTLRPKHEDEPGRLRTGDLDFDDAFFIEGTSHRAAMNVLHAEVRRALFVFGPYGESFYDHGAFRFEWESREEPPFAEIERALAIAAAVCRAPEAGYRGP